MLLKPDEIKFTVLYTLSQYETPISLKDLSLILTWEGTPILEFFELSIALGELIEDDYVKKTFSSNEEKYCLTGKGAETNEFFGNRVPPSVRGFITDTIGAAKFEELANPNRIIGDILPISNKQFMATCSIVDNKTPLLELNLYVGTKSEASRVAKHFKNNAAEIYQQILTLFDAGAS